LRVDSGGKTPSKVDNVDKVPSPWPTPQYKQWKRSNEQGIGTT
jgi:hypothetical protein